jgi:hypothetical protein
VLLRKKLVKSRIVRFLNVKFNKEGLITKPLLKKKDKKKANIQIPIKNKSKAINQNRQDNNLIY